MTRPGRRALAWTVSFAALVVACAVSVPPSGGPEDRTPPSVTATVPVRDSAGVAADSDIRITFSEDMTRRGIERNLEFSPPIVFEKPRWEGPTVSIRAAGGLHPDTTYVVTLQSGFQDYHRVASEKSYRFAFATAAAIDSGRIDGKVLFRREPTATGIVNCYLMRDTVFVPAATRPERQAKTDESGAFSIDYLGVEGRSYIVWAFEDRNKDGRFAPDDDVGWTEIDTVTLTPGIPFATGVTFAIVDPDEPGVVRGRVVNATGVDTMGVSVALFSTVDSLAGRAAYYMQCDTTGAYEWGAIRAGTYRLQAFIDFAPDSLCGGYPCGSDSSDTCPEPCAAFPDSIVVEPGDEHTLRPFELGAAP